MTFDEFLGKVQNRAKLASTGEAVSATRATLEVLGERLFGGEPGDLAAQLPREIQLFLLRPGPRDSFDLSDFFDRVSLREGVDLPLAVFHAKAVMSVLKEAVSPGEWEDMLSQLPQSYNELFNWEDEGWMKKAA